MVFAAPCDSSDTDAEELSQSESDDAADDSALCVSHAPAPPFNVNASRVPCSFFVVTRVDVGAERSDSHAGYFRIDLDITRVITEGVVHRRVPFVLETFLACSPSTALAPVTREDVLPGTTATLLPLESTSVMTTYGVCPAVWAPAIAQLGSLFLPSLLNKSVSAPPVTLLTAPQRAGKRLLVTMTARMLGMHVVEVNAYDLLGPSERDTESKVHDVLQAAVSVAPCVLHVRRYHAFKVPEVHSFIHSFIHSVFLLI
jgi:hypothetical protein